MEIFPILRYVFSNIQYIEVQSILQFPIEAIPSKREPDFSKVSYWIPIYQLNKLNLLQAEAITNQNQAEKVQKTKIDMSFCSHCINVHKENNCLN